jgi:hypothetical protein
VVASALYGCPLLALLGACAAPVAAPAVGPGTAAPSTSTVAPDGSSAHYRSVHIDTLAPDKLGQFEGGRRAWVAELRRANVSDGRGVFLQVEGNRFYTVRSFATFGSFDTRVATINAALARVPKEAAERYRRDSDESLVFPHLSEIWEVDDELSFVPAEGALTETTAAVGSLVVDDVRPDPGSEERYRKAHAEINLALAAIRYPLTRRSFDCVFGAGHLTTLVLAPSKEALEAAPTLEAAVARARGPARAAELTAAIASSVERSEAHSLVVRRDLTWP